MTTVKQCQYNITVKNVDKLQEILQKEADPEVVIVSAGVEYTACPDGWIMKDFDHPEMNDRLYTLYVLATLCKGINVVGDMISDGATALKLAYKNGNGSLKGFQKYLKSEQAQKDAFNMETEMYQLEYLKEFIV